MNVSPVSLTTQAVAQRVVARTLELACVAAPTFEEQERTDLVAAWWSTDGLSAVQVDEIGNVWAQLRPGRGPALVVCAHLDTVFGRDVAHGLRWEGTALIGPGVGDDTVAVASLSALDALLPEANRHPLWILATVGEEGLGDLRGVRWALEHPPSGADPIGALIAVEGNYLNRVCVTGVGSARWEIQVHAPGGHAWEDSDVPSAVHVAADLVTRIAEIQRPGGARTSVNVGTISGGESINSRAQTCVFQVDLRSDRPEALNALQRATDAVLADVGEPVSVLRTPIGLRPAGGIALDHPLVRASVAALASAGRRAELVAASTDANAAYARGMPAVTVGITEGDGTHTQTEWIRTEHIPAGLTALAETIVTFDHEEW